MFVLIWRFVENPTASANLGFYHLKMVWPENGAPHDLDLTATITAEEVWTVTIRSREDLNGQIVPREVLSGCDHSKEDLEG